MAEMLRYPSTGCIVEYLEGNAPQIAMVVGENGERMRLLLPNRRELNLPKNRILPWIGPQYQEKSREESVRLLEQHKNRRVELESSVNALEIWEMAQGEVSQAGAAWCAELVLSDPDLDEIAAVGHALLLQRTHFRFHPPFFQVYTAEEAEKRLADQNVRLEREALLAGGRAFFQMLWEVALGRRKLPEPGSTDLRNSEWPEDAVQERLENLLRTRMLNPNDSESEVLWNQLSRGLPEAPQLPLQLLLAWKKVPEHYNVWLASSGYEAGDSWWEPVRQEVELLREQVRACDSLAMSTLPLCDLPFISIDSESTRDVDDAFLVRKTEQGWALTVALANPAFVWPFGGNLDRMVLERGTSIYLPEMTCHMLPECLGTDSYSLRAKVVRPAFLLSFLVLADGSISACTPSCARVKLAANLNYVDCEAVLSGDASKDNPGLAFASDLGTALEMAEALQKARIRDGAVIMERAEPHITLSGDGSSTRVELVQEPMTAHAQLLVSECMIAASTACAQYATSHGIPMLHRTQQVKLPPECAGIWTEPAAMARIMRLLVPSMLEIEAGPHAALGVRDYTPVTSPLRRYADLVNISQITSYLARGQARFEREELLPLLGHLETSLERAGVVQRLRPRYWKLVYFRQKGDRVWWKGVVTEENDSFVMVNLPAQAMTIRAKRQLFDERTGTGSEVRVRIGKVQPLWNEIQILEALPDDACAS